MVAINGYNFDVFKIVDYLRPFRDNLALSYDWGSPTRSDLDKAFKEGLFTNDEMETLFNMGSSYERNVYIKHAISKKLAHLTKENEADYYNWIVKVWGGIKAYNKSPEYVKANIKTLLDDNHMNFDGIASMSKIASFMFPGKFVIYDARVCYSLNWILLKKGASDKYFPVPESRNTKLNAFGIDVIIRLVNIENYRINQEVNSNSRSLISHIDKKLYIAQEEAYMTMCDLVNQINNMLWDNDHEKKSFPFHTEMILFAMADREIFLDITNSCKLKAE